MSYQSVQSMALQGNAPNQKLISIGELFL